MQAGKILLLTLALIPAQIAPGERIWCESFAQYGGHKVMERCDDKR